MDENDLKLLETRNELHKEIERFGIELEAIQKNITEAEQKKSDIEELNKEIASLTITKNDLIAAEKEISDLTSQRDTIISDITKTQEIIVSFSEKVEEVNTLRTEIIDLNTEIERAIVHRDNLVGELQAIEILKKESNDKLAALDGYFVEKKDGIAKKISEYEITAGEKTKSIDNEISLKIQIYEGLIATIGNKKTEIEGIEAEKNTLLSEYQNLDKVFADKKSAKESEIEAISTELENRKTALDEKEGSLSVLASTLEQKRSTLVSIKTRLEKEFGKSINIEI